MNGNLLKSTKCSGACEFSKISIFCYDCPSLMCDKCEKDGHFQFKHNVTKFKNENLPWHNREFIFGLFEDIKIGSAVYNEVTRVCQEPTPIEREVIEQWRCEVCKTDNPMANKTCRMCKYDKGMNELKIDYNKKLESLSIRINSIFAELSVHHEAVFEHVAAEYLSYGHDVLNFDKWFEEVYLNGKILSLVYEVIKDNHHMSMKDLNEKYSDLVQIKNSDLIKKLPQSFVTEDMRNTTEPIRLVDTNKKNQISEEMKGKEISGDDVWQIIIRDGKYTECQTRMIMIELDLESIDNVQLLRAFMNDVSFSQYLKESIGSDTVKLQHLRQALLEQVTIDDAFNFLRRECSICSLEFPMPEMQSLMTCEHEMCKTCFSAWLNESITTKYPCKWNCPICPEESYKNIDRILHYYNLRKFLQDDKSYEKTLKIFDQKLLHEQLMGSEFFYWCSNDLCEYGFEAEGLEGKIQCTMCKTYMCVGCNRKWHEDHENVTCYEYEMSILKNEESKLATLLKEIGIECPTCRMRYALAPGGCLHFDCKACNTSFCGACYEIFVSECDLARCIIGNAFHAHHPRNCIFYLRDHDIEKLEEMLQNSDYPKLANKPEINCPYLICDKATMQEKSCNDQVHGTTGLCPNHYKEYLVQFINRFKVDPVDFVGSFELNLMLYQGRQPKIEKIQQENENDFIARLRQEVKKLPTFFIPKGLQENVKEAAEVVIE